MKAMILAAGEGSRLRPLTDTLPKCMVDVGGKPLMQHTIEWLHEFGVNDIVINVCHLPDVIPGHFGDGRKWGVRLTYSREETQLGTAGGVRNVAPFFAGEPFFVWYGDNLSTCDLERFRRFHEERGGLGSVALHWREDVGQSGIVEMDARKRIVRFVEKPAASQVFSHWVNAGIYLLEPGVLELVPPGVPQDFARDVFPLALASERGLFGYELSENELFAWVDRPEDLERGRRRWSGRT